jgi:hypothetical protein
VGFVKPGWFRRITLATVLWALDYAARHVYNNGNLAGIRTIHFARWVFLDDKRRLIFASNYDGSLESYMDDFIDKVAWGLNAAFSNGSYPRHDGCSSRGQNRPSRTTYATIRSHPDLLSRYYGGQHREQRAIRAGLHDTMTDQQVEAWVKRLATSLSWTDQGIVAAGYGHLRGCFVLLRIEPGASGAPAANTWLGRSPIRSPSPGRARTTTANVAFTRQGSPPSAESRRGHTFSAEFVGECRHLIQPSTRRQGRSAGQLGMGRSRHGK